LSSEASRFVMRPTRELDHKQAIDAARLVRSALPGYFEAMGAENADSVIMSDFESSGTELQGCQAAVVDGSVAGILCTYPMAELAERQYRSVQLVARSLGADDYLRFAASLRTLRSGLPTIAGEGIYLAFIAVDDSAKGSGLANQIMREAVLAAGSAPLLLTVKNDNRRARTFYERHGFELAEEGNQFSLLERRSPSDEASPAL
jgi:ribosomal protein S18 acetylase RimI-like enzyme